MSIVSFLGNILLLKVLVLSSCIDLQQNITLVFLTQVFWPISATR